MQALGLCNKNEDAVYTSHENVTSFKWRIGKSKVAMNDLI